MKTALKLLSLRMRSVSELEDKLGAKGFCEDDIKKTIASLTDAGYLDDRKYAFALASSRTAHRNWGPSKIRAYLSKKGVNKGLIEAAIRENTALSQDALLKALEKWMKMNRARPPLERNAAARLFRSLAQKGFSPGEILIAMKNHCSSGCSPEDG